MQNTLSPPPLIEQRPPLEGRLAVDASPDRLSVDFTERHDAQLRKLFPLDYEYYMSSGLDDLFYQDPETGEDGLMHILVGEVVVDKNGFEVPQGFHHEPSAALIHGDDVHTTRVDRDHLIEANSKARKRYRERPLEPYGAQVVIGGLKKLFLQRDQNGSKLIPVINSMYPKEYDALGVVQTIKRAYETIDPEQDVSSHNSKGEEVVVNMGTAPLLDGQSEMRIRFVLDPATRKIRSAMPVDSNGIMNLTPEEAEEVIFR